EEERQDQADHDQERRQRLRPPWRQALLDLRARLLPGLPQLVPSGVEGVDLRRHRSRAGARRALGLTRVLFPVGSWRIAHPASLVSSPSRPRGRSTMIITRYPNTIAGVHCGPIRASDSCWIHPMIRPPSTAPRMLPIPPITAAVNAIRPASKPWKYQIVVS